MPTSDPYRSQQHWDIDRGQLMHQELDIHRSQLRPCPSISRNTPSSVECTRRSSAPPIRRVVVCKLVQAEPNSRFARHAFQRRMAKRSLNTVLW
ncbi:hypothetical protein CF319_g9253, partial [Tilletia indica]